MENLHGTGRPPKSDSKGDRRIIRHVKTHRKQTLAEITNCVNNILPQQPLSSRTVRRRLRYSGFTRREIRKQIVISRVNRARRVCWCRQKLTWKTDDWKSVIFSDETQVVIGQNKKKLHLEKAARSLATGMSWWWQVSQNICNVLGLYLL